MSMPETQAVPVAPPAPAASAPEAVPAAADPVVLSTRDLVDALGRPRFHAELAERLDRPGVATGLAWTPAGGDVLFVEAALVPAANGGGGALQLTGMLGEVMRESAQAALTFLRSNAARLRLPERAFALIPLAAIDGRYAGLLDALPPGERDTVVELNPR